MARSLSLAEIFQLGYYWECKVLLTAVKLDLFGAIAGQARTPADVARRLHADPHAVELLMNALVAIGLLRKNAEHFANSPEADQCLVKGSPSYAGHLLLLQDAEWENWGKLEATIQTGKSPVKEHLFRSDPRLAENVLLVLHRVALQHAPTLARQIDLTSSRTLLDLGGGAGTHAMAFCQAYPSLRATVFDLPETLQTTARLVKDAKLEDRITLLSGDFNRDPLGGPYDAVLMSDILHYQDAGSNAALVRKVYQALSGAGCVIIKDRFLDEDRTAPAWTAVFAVHLMVNTEKGRCYTLHEVSEWLTAAGFRQLEEIEPSSIVKGVK